MIPSTGGFTRVTHHPAGENLSDWTPDGKLLFISNGLAGLQRQLRFTVSPTGGMPESCRARMARFFAISRTGRGWCTRRIPWITGRGRGIGGGMALMDIWLFNLKDNSSKRITDWEGVDTIPMWVPGGDGKTLHHHSDNGPSTG